VNDFEQLNEYFNKAKSDKIQFSGNCHDCWKEVMVKIKRKDDKVIIKGGAVYFPNDNDFFVKCKWCA